ncbi:MAG: hypothetical protein ACRERY_07070 [Pseudomonas sp.]
MARGRPERRLAIVIPDWLVNRPICIALVSVAAPGWGNVPQAYNLLLVKIADEAAKSMEQPLWQRLRDDGIYTSGRIQLYVAEHRLIDEAIVQGDGDAAAFYVEQHIKWVRRDMAPR